jgi:hypothetical protein
MDLSMLFLETDMTKVVVVFHSGYGHTTKQAEAVALGAKGTLVAIDAEGNISESDWALLDQADAIVFGSPTYMGMTSWQFKKDALHGRRLGYFGGVHKFISGDGGLRQSSRRESCAWQRRDQIKH